MDIKYFVFYILFPLNMGLVSCCKDVIDPSQLISNCIGAITTIENDSTEYYKYVINKAKWDCHNINHYSFIQKTKYELCAGTEHLIEVSNNEIVNVKLITPTEFIDTVSVLCGFFTIEYYFSRIEDATDERTPIPRTGFYPGGPLYLADEVKISYDIEYGYPRAGIIDYSGYADDEFPFEMSDLKILDR